MNLKIRFLILAVLALPHVPLWAQTSIINYRGWLTASGSPANGKHDMEFRLFAAPEVGSGAQQGATQGQLAVPVTNGVFTVALDFGSAVFDGSPRFLEISVRPTGSLAYTTLAPRQRVASIPYAIHSLSAESAAALLSGAAVQSLNNLKDNVTLVAGANVTITPIGNTLTIASLGGTGNSGLWSPAGNDAFYNAGNVGIGTSAPAAGYRLDVSGATILRPGNGTVQFGSPNAELGMSITPTAGNRADLRFDGSVLKLLAGAGGGPPSSANGLSITTDGNVGIGEAPTLGYRLEVTGATRLSPANGTMQFGTPNAELGMSITPNAGNRADLRFDGSVLKLVASAGVAPPSPANGVAITTEGNVGIGTTAPDAKLHVEKTQPGTAIYGHALGAGGVGAYGHAPNSGGIGVLGSAGAGSIGVYAGNTVGGTAVYADGNATQKADKGGFVKAMAYIDPYRLPADYVVNCYNSQQAGDASSTAPCGITVTRTFEGLYTIDFGFNIENRFISLTPRGYYAGSAGAGNGLRTGIVSAVSGNKVTVAFSQLDDPEHTSDTWFYILVY